MRWLLFHHKAQEVIGQYNGPIIEPLNHARFSERAHSDPTGALSPHLPSPPKLMCTVPSGRMAQLERGRDLDLGVYRAVTCESSRHKGLYRRGDLCQLTMGTAHHPKALGARYGNDSA